MSSAGGEAGDGRGAVTTVNGARPELRVCYFGAYDPDYTRVRMVINGLRDSGVEVVECRATSTNRLKRCWQLVGAFVARGRPMDLILVSENGQLYTPLAKLLGLVTNKPVVLDAFLSHYLLSVIEKHTVPAGSLRAKLLYLVDYVACRMADKVLLDTEEHIQYFCKEFRADRRRFEDVPIGADDTWFRPDLARTADDVPRSSSFGVVWIGTYYPLQGLEYVIEAADLLRNEPDVRFDLYGAGPLRPRIVNEAKRLMLSNVVFHDWIAPAAVPGVLGRADLCLGQFGTTLQAGIVVPCKVYEALAMARPLLTASTPTIRRYLRHRETAYLCPPGDPKAIADAVMELKRDRGLRDGLAQRGLDHFRATGSRARVGARVKAICEEMMSRKRELGSSR